MGVWQSWSIAPVLKTGGPSGSLSSNLSAPANWPVRLVGLGRQIFILEITNSNLVRASIGSQAKIGKYLWNSEAFTNRIRPATSEPKRGYGENW